MVKRFLEIRPPIAAVIPEFQSIIDEIEHAYVLGYPFAALSASCVSTERLLNLARIQLHKHHPKIKDLWNKGPLNEWDGNIEALEQWGYFDAALSVELKWVFRNIRCKYLHSGEITDLASDALRAVQAAYRVLCWAYR